MSVGAQECWRSDWGQLGISFFIVLGYNDYLPVKMEVSFRMPGKALIQPAHLSANTLAFVGDAVFALYVRERLARELPGTVHRLHQRSTDYVKASAQAQIVQALFGELTEEETAIFKRGRNVKTTTMPRNADMHDYRQATGFESLLGYLHLSEKTDRLMELLNRAAEIIEQA